MSFEVDAEAYDRHVGRYGVALAQGLFDVSGLIDGTALDVGSGPGALASFLAERLLPERVAAVDPSESFIAAVRARLPGVEARRGTAEALPFEDGSFDAAFAQLVVNFMTDPERGVGEMRRVVRSGGVVAAAVWDYGGEMTLLHTFWEAAAARFPDRADTVDERTRMAFARRGELEALFGRVGLADTRGGALDVSARYEDFDDLWFPFERGVGPAGAFVVSLNAAERDELRGRVHEMLGRPEGPFELSARAWFAVGTV
jgi:SAM-dependent methyltransferase